MSYLPPKPKYFPPKGSLQLLIQDNRGKRSYASLAKDCGFTAATADRQVHRLAHDPITKFISPGTIEGLARGLNVSVLTVLKAAAISVGLAVDPGSDDLTITGCGKLSIESRKLVTDTALHLRALEAA